MFNWLRRNKKQPEAAAKTLPIAKRCAPIYTAQQKRQFAAGSTPYRPSPTDNSFATSMILGAALDDGILGGVIGGNIAGGLIGQAIADGVHTATVPDTTPAPSCDTSSSYSSSGSCDTSSSSFSSSC